MWLPGGQILGYCTNVHPYATLPGLIEVLGHEPATLRRRLVASGRLAADAPLGLGLWLPAAAARAAAADPAPLRRRLESLGLRAFTVNAFPLSDFHGARVKDEVFRPGWAEPARLEATLDAARALAALLPAGVTGTISTHTGAYRAWGPPLTDETAIARGLLAAAEGLAALREHTGRHIRLALEPEPFSTLETSAQAADFFARRLLPAGEAAREHLGLCFDACHQAVEFEEPGAALATLRAAGVTIGKVQLSAALVLCDPARHSERLRPWAEDRWFHQVVARGADGTLRHVPDLPEALASQDPAIRGAAEWRVHFHVPLFARELEADGALRTTQPELAALLARPELREVEHLEVETYSFAMIPPERRAALGVPTLLDALEREMNWVLDQLGTARGSGC
jgi:sugar phosphate isomerase/epimerase